jgi:hypothetical protein
MSILDYFDDWQTMTIALYGLTTTYNPSTGQMTESWALRETKEAFVSQASAGRGLFTDRQIDEADFMIRVDGALTRTDIIYFNNEWFSMPYPNDHLFQNELYTSLIKRIDTPSNVSGTLPTVSVLGDFGGVI